MVQPQARRRRLLALDPGQRRTGVAVSDELGMLAHPRPAIVHGSRAELLARVAELVAREEADEVVVGLPLSMSGGDSAQTTEARALAQELRSRLGGVRVSEFDERLSSAEAERRAPGKRDRRSGDLDSLAAALVLQAVLDSRRARSEG